MRDSDFDPVDTLVREALTPGRPAAQRLAKDALAATPARSRPLVPALAAVGILAAGALGVWRYRPGDTPIVIRDEAGAIVIERGSGKDKTVEIVRDRPSTGGVVVIREGGD